MWKKATGMKKGSILISVQGSNLDGTSSHIELEPHTCCGECAGSGARDLPFSGMAADPPSFSCLFRGPTAKFPADSQDAFQPRCLGPFLAFNARQCHCQFDFTQSGALSTELQTTISARYPSRVISPLSCSPVSLCLQVLNRAEHGRSPFRSTQTLSAPAPRRPRTPVISRSCRPVRLPWSSLSLRFGFHCVNKHPKNLARPPDDPQTHWLAVPRFPRSHIRYLR